jgi:hypothetical protein
MKVLFDPIYSQQPRVCSSAAKFKKLAERLLAEKPDTFVYWLIPKWADDASRTWLPTSDRIKYIEQDKWHDRVREYMILYSDLEHSIAFNGDLWDFDVLITMRTQQVPNMRTLMFSTRQRNATWTKAVHLLEEMAVFSWRKTVPVSEPEIQDMMTTLGYLYADASYITAGHIREGAIRTARRVLPPSAANQVAKKLHLVNPMIVENYDQKPAEAMFQRGQMPFCMGYIGRTSNSMTRLPEIYNVMEKHWITKGDLGFKVIMSTVTTTIKLQPPEFVKVEHNPRDVFWSRLKNDMHLVLSMSVDAEFAAGLIESMMLGTPVVLAREDWTESLLGKDYPFFVKGELQAYAAVKLFHEDYANQYAKFMAWRDSAFKERFSTGVYKNNLYDLIANSLNEWEPAMRARYADQAGEAAKNNDICQRLVKLATEENSGHIRMFKDIKTLIDRKEIDGGIRVHIAPDARDDGRSMPFMMVWNDYRLKLKSFYGFEDASTEVGHLKLKSQQ